MSARSDNVTLPLSSEFFVEPAFLGNIPAFRGGVFLLKNLAARAKAVLTLRTGYHDFDFSLDLAHEFELGMLLHKRGEVAIPYVIARYMQLHNLSGFYDVGANVGWVSRVLLALRPSTQIVAVEPEGRCCDRIENWSPPSLQVFRCVLSHSDGLTMMQNRPSVFSGPSSNFFSTTEAGSNVAIHTSLTLDSLRGLSHVPADVIKIDVEGAETLVLQGARQKVLEEAQMLIVEVGESERQKRVSSLGVNDLYELCSSFGFNFIYVIDNDKNLIARGDMGEVGDIVFCKERLNLKYFED